MPDTLTPRLALKKPDPTDLYDVTKFNDNFQKIDDVIGATICTSSTRPSSPFSGQEIYETDSGLSYVWNGAAWILPRGALYATTTRPTVGLYNGYTIYRTDKSFYETYDGTAWRVRGVQLVAALADITNPVTEQRAILSTDGSPYRWTGSAWEIIREMKLLKRGERSTVGPSSTGADVEVMRVDGTSIRSGRLIWVTTDTCHPNSSATGDNIRTTIRYSTSGTATASSTILPAGRAYTLFGNSCVVSGFLTPGSNLTLSVALCVGRETGSGACSLYADGDRRTQLKIYDLGVDPGDTSVDAP